VLQMGVSKTQTSTPKRSDPLDVLKTQAHVCHRLFQNDLFTMSYIYCRQNLREEREKEKSAVEVDSSALFMKIIPNICIIFWLPYKYKPNLSN